MNCQGWLATPPGSGGVAIIEIHGDVEALLERIAPPGPWPIGELKLRGIAQVDTGIIVRLGEHHAQLTPHGGPHVVQRIAQEITAVGATWLNEPLHNGYPEARDEIEARVLATIARAQSPAAIPLLLEQPQRWRNNTSPLSEEERATSQRLNRLIDPPLVAVIGPPNAGKSTLFNALLGREGAIVSPQAGTTRDHVGALIDIGGIVVQWIDTPGLRKSSDPLETEAIERALDVIADADMTLGLIAPDTPLSANPTEGVDFLVVNKADLEAAAGLAKQFQAHLISSASGMGIETLLGRIREALLPSEDLQYTGRWDLSVAGGTDELRPHE